MAVAQPPDEKPAGAPVWIVTFADLMSLLLTFFVLLLSFSTMEIDKFNTMAGSIKSAFGMRSPFDLMNHVHGEDLRPAKTFGDDGGSKKVEVEEQQSIQRTILVQLREVLEKNEMEQMGSVRVSPRGVVLELDGDVVYENGGIDLNLAARRLLDMLARVSETNASVIEIEGHTDNTPISTARFASNWELSAARAARAARYLAGKGVRPARLRAVGHGDSMPLVSNDTAAGRARNRRLSFLFLTSQSYRSPNAPSAR